jgi:dTDP-4-amino-4,6-dideoxygalactose transaminase
LTTTTTDKKIWLSSPHMGGNEEAYVKEAFDSNWIAPLGPNVNLFEKALETYLGDATHVATLSSGTAAIHLALKILGVTAGDEVICQSFTFSASANPIAYLGATPIFVDSETETWNMSPILLEKAIVDRIRMGKKPKAIIAVHLYGMPYKVDEITAIGHNYNIPIIEDSAEALGSTFKNHKCGTFGSIGILSFNGNKIITTSGGGALCSNNEKYKERAIYLATQARDDAPHYQHSEIGHNYRMSNVLAGIGRGQMEVLPDHVNKRRSNFEFYSERLGHLKGISFLDEPNHFFSNRWLTCLLTDSYEKREAIRISLQEYNIESRPLWKPLHLQPVFLASPVYEDGTAKNLFERGLCLPSGSNLHQEDLDLIVQLISKILA